MQDRLSELMRKLSLIVRHIQIRIVPEQDMASTRQNISDLRSQLRVDEIGSKFESEIDFWDVELSGRGLYYDEIECRSKPERMSSVFPHHILQLLEDRHVSNRIPRVLDVGSGPLSMLAFGAEQRLLSLWCVDPLSDVYHRLLLRHGFDLHYPLIKCTGEHLSTFFGEDVFDLVWMRNAIDHTQDPETVFKELVKVLAPGGYLVLQMWCREGTAEGFNGLHIHDFTLEQEGRLMLETLQSDGRLSAPRCISEGMPLRLIEASSPSSDVKTWIKLIWKKLPPLSQPSHRR